MKTDAKHSDYLLMGAITGAHGIRGELKVRSFTADPLAITDYTPLYSADGKQTYAIEFTGGTVQSLIARLPGITDRNAAEAMRGTELYALRDKLPEAQEEEYYHEDLTGLAVRKPEGASIGSVIAVHNYGAGDLLEIRFASGSSELFAFTRSTFPTIDLREGSLTFIPPEVVEG